MVELFHLIKDQHGNVNLFYIHHHHLHFDDKIPCLNRVKHESVLMIYVSFYFCVTYTSVMYAHKL